MADPFDLYKTPRLLAIVGSNPLPAAVAATLLTAPGGEVTLVCTRTSRRVADSLKVWLTGKRIKCAEPLEVQEASMRQTMEKVTQRLQRGTGRVGLNYTGGTKSMSVHVYRAVEDLAQWAKDDPSRQEPIFSYLDARSLGMVFDVQEGEGVAPVVPIPQSLKIGLLELIRMHDWEAINADWKPKGFSDVPILLEPAQILAEMYASGTGKGSLYANWKVWKRAFRSDCGRNDPINGFEWKSKGELRNKVITFPDALSSFRAALPNRILTEGGLNLGRSWAVCNVPPEVICKYLDGTWLESLVLDALRGIAPKLGMHDYGMNLEVRAPDNVQGQPAVEFELDNVVMRGHQLFAFSCGTSIEKKELKLKFFEAYTRAHQIGGDQARVALVCPSTIPETLEREVRGDLGREGRVKVFGRSHLADLQGHIHAWIEEQSRPGEAR